jgi:hypothetical protein
VRRLLAAVATIVLLAACGSANDRPGTVRANPCNADGCSGPGAQVNVAYTYRLSTHCGVLEIRFDGRVFYLESINPAAVLVGLDQPEDIGTMALLSAHLAVFQDAAGHTVRFVDSPPGSIGKAYPFTVYVYPGDQLIDVRFAGRTWHALGTLPGVSGPRYGNGQDRSTAVTGNMTLVSRDKAAFVTPSGSTVEFVRANPVLGCD